MSSHVALWIEGYLHRTKDAAAVALSTVPLLLIYGLGLLWASPEARSGVDFLSTRLLSVVPTVSYIGLQLGLAVFLVFFALFRAQKTFTTHLQWGSIAIAEACIWGLSLGSIVTFFLVEVYALQVGGGGMAWVDRVVLSAGAGLYEELLFRALLLPALAFTLNRLTGLAAGGSIFVAIVLGALLFSAAHHLAGEPFDSYVFSYRSVAGVVFAGLYYWRGFAIAAWSHAAYDFLVV